MNRLLSVVVPIYKVEAHLDRCVMGILNQEYSNIELILVDDGSPDNSPAICDKWAEKDSRVRVLHKVNGGLADARNAGLEIATGKYVSFIDGDDTICPEMYSRMVSEMELSGAQIACCGKNKIYGEKVVQTQNSGVKLHMTAEEAIARLLEGIAIDESACDKVFERALFEEIRFPKGEINEDLPVMPLLFGKATIIVHVADSYYNYFQNVGSITRSGYSAKMHVYIEHLESIEKYINENYPALEKSLSVLKARYACSMLYRMNDNPENRKTFAADYMWYRKTFRTCALQYILNHDIGTKNRILALAMYLGFGNVVSKLRILIKGK